MKIDLVMWALNSERTLNKSLKSIDEAIPAKLVNQKIMIDGHSHDKTKSIGESFGWEVFDAKRVGIPYQANQALDLVSTGIFARAMGGMLAGMLLGVVGLMIWVVKRGSSQ